MPNLLLQLALLPLLCSTVLAKDLKKEIVPAAVAYFSQLDENSSLCQEIGITFLKHLEAKGLKSWSEAKDRAIARYQGIYDSDKWSASSEECQAAKQRFEHLLSSQSKHDIMLESLVAFMEPMVAHDPCASGTIDFFRRYHSDAGTEEGEDPFQKVFSAAAQHFIMASMDPSSLFTQRCSDSGVIIHQLLSNIFASTLKKPKVEL
eukprot:maker-scaffold224_size251237-snap-gene-1.49 protein:Tk05451 transcript:maker-scaffold224_size251237-snap-gene-1.49-mRNA-1 annotation:"serine protease"